MANRDTVTSSPGLFVVFGGTGFLGRRIVRALLSAGHRVRIAARNPDPQEAEEDPDELERVHADLFVPATLRAALRGATGAVNATSLYVERDEISFASVHVEAAERLARLARHASLMRFVQISGIGADPDAGDRYIRARGRGEDVVRAAFPDAVIVRPSMMFGEGDALVSAILRAARLSPAIPLFGSGRTRLQPVAADDVAQGIVTLLTCDDPQPIYEFGGPRVLEYRDMVAEILNAAELRRALVPWPFTLWRMMAHVAQNLPGAPLTTSQVALVEGDNIADAKLPGLDDLLPERTDFAEHLRQQISR